MTIFVVSLVLLLILLLWYALQGRAWLKSKPSTAGFFAFIEPFEIAIYKKSEAILVARLKMLIGVSLSVLTYIGTIDLTPIMPLVPEKYAGYVHTAINMVPLALSVLGLMDERLRNQTTLPIEIIAAPEKNMTPEVKEAIAMAVITKTEAVAVVTQAAADAKKA